jgi:very-short-patch-repair endonuclease
MQLPRIERLGRPVAHRRRVVAAGLSTYRVRTAVATGRWQQPLPGVVVGHSGPLTRLERWQAALEYGGPDAVLSHRSALCALGARVSELPLGPRPGGVRGDYELPPEGGLVEISAVHGRHLRSTGFVVVHQSRRPLQPAGVHAGLPVCSAARAAVDVAVTVARRQDVEHVVADVLQRGLCSVPDLHEQARALGRRCTPWLAAALGDARRGMRSVGENDLRRVVVAAGLPEPEWNAEVATPWGTFFVDALWRRQRVAAEADGAAFHLSADDWQADLRRQNAIQGTGLTLFRFPVRRLRAEPQACGCELGAVLR